MSKDPSFSDLSEASKPELIAEVHRLRCMLGNLDGMLDAMRDRDATPQAPVPHAHETDTQDQASPIHAPALYEVAYEAVPVPYFTLDDAGTILKLNGAARCLLGVDSNAVTNSPLARFVCASDQAKLAKHMRQCRNTDGPTVSDVHLRDKHDHVIPVQLTSYCWTARVAGAAEPRVVYWTAVTDLTERKQLENELRASQERLHLAQSVGGVGTWDIDLVEQKMSFSDEHYRLLGLEPGGGEPTLESWKQCLHPEDRDEDRLAELCRRFHEGGAVDYRVLTPEGNVRWLSSRGRIMRDDAGNDVRVVGVTVDITETKQAAQKLQELNEALLQRTLEVEQRAAQLRAVAAQLTQTENRERRRLALVLHDHLQQFLVAARMKLGVIRQRLQTPDLTKLLVQTAELVDEAIQASRSLSVELSPPILHEAGLAATFEWLGQQMEEKHGFRVEAASTDEPEDDDIRIFLFQCVRELLLNAVKHAGTDSASVRMDRLDDDSIAIRVEDRGKGFDVKELQANWSAGKSFGLLSIRERLELLGGRVEIDSEPGCGTRTTLVAPVRKPRGRPAAMERFEEATGRQLRESDEVQPVQAPPIRILVADDHPIVRQGLTSLLEHEKDFRIVAQAADAQSAVETACALDLDVVLMDYSMPRVNGAEATRRILEAKPNLPVIGMSVYDEQNVADAMRQAGVVAFFRKDESSEQIITAIRAYGRPAPRLTPPAPL